MRRIRAFLWDKRGSATVEATFIIPIVVLCVCALFYVVMLLYQNVLLQSQVNRFVERASAVWNHSYKDFNTGRLEMQDVNKEDLYWRFFDRNKTKKLETAQRETNIDRQSLLTSQKQDKVNRVSVAVADYGIYKKLTVQALDEYHIPIERLLAGLLQKKRYTMGNYSENVVNDPAEFIRNIDFLADIEREVERKNPEVKDTMGKMREGIEEIRKIIEKFVEENGED